MFTIWTKMGGTDQNRLHLKRCSDSILTWQHSDGHFIVDPVNEQKKVLVKARYQSPWKSVSPIIN